MADTRAAIGFEEGFNLLKSPPPLYSLGGCQWCSKCYLGQIWCKLSIITAENAPSEGAISEDLSKQYQHQKKAQSALFGTNKKQI